MSSPLPTNAVTTFNSDKLLSSAFNDFMLKSKSSDSSVKYNGNSRNSNGNHSFSEFLKINQKFFWYEESKNILNLNLNLNSFKHFKYKIDFIKYPAPLINRLFELNKCSYEYRYRSVLEIGAERYSKSLEDFKMLNDDIGKGSTGTIKLVSKKNDPYYTVVLKIIEKRKIGRFLTKDPKFGKVPTEVSILNRLHQNSHPNISRIVDFFEDKNFYYIEMEYGTNGSLNAGTYSYNEIYKSIFSGEELELEEDTIKTIFKQITKGIQHLHKTGIVHRDISYTNILLNSQNQVQIIDFGASKLIENGPFRQNYTASYFFSPEMIKYERAVTKKENDEIKLSGKPQDIWSMGIILYMLLRGIEPFDLDDEILAGLPEDEFPIKPPNSIANLICGMLNISPESRMTIDDVAEHIWMS